MSTTLSEHAQEQSTYIVSTSFLDSEGAAITPTSVIWTLTDEHNTIINGRDAVNVPSPTPVVDIVLAGDDLAILEDRPVCVRYLTIEALYDSAHGTDLPIKDQIVFYVDNLRAVT